MKRYILIIFLVLLCSISCNSRKSKAEQKTAKTCLSENEEKSLIALGQLWGFLKYHHPAVAKGDYDWDMELFNLIDPVRNAESEYQWKKLLDDWLDNLPPVTENPDKKLPDLEIKTKPDYGELFNPEYFLPETIDKVKYILNNAVISTNHYVNVDIKQWGQLSFPNEPSYDGLSYPVLSHRLLALFRFWNIVNYFFPHRELCDQKWTSVLSEMLPDFINTENREQYILTCLKLAAKLNDSHVVLYENKRPYSWGERKVPFETQFIENRLIVTMYTRDDTFVKEKIKIGDAVVAVNGESVDDIAKRMSVYTPASNNAVKLRRISSNILRGNTDNISVTVFRDGNSFEVNVPCYHISQLKIPVYSRPYPEKEGYSVLENNIGYVLPSNCVVEDLGKGLKKILDETKGIIVDMRCYPNVPVSSSIVTHFKLENTRFYPSLRSYANVSYPGYFFVQNKHHVPEIAKYRYMPKIVVLVNEITQSQAEGHVQDLQTLPDVVVIGSTTAGANGRVVYFNLPCNVNIKMTGIGVYYFDGSEVQRTGVKIDQFVKPTIAGIKAGRDELLERAIDIIEEYSKNNDRR